MSEKICLLISLLALGACTSAPTTVDTEVVRKEIENTWEAFITAWEAEDATACAAFYLTDGRNIGPEAPVRSGREAIAEFYTFLFSNNQQSEYTHEILELHIDQNQATELGQFTVDWTTNDTTRWKYEARSMTHWKKTDAGWRINAFLFNQAPPRE